MEQTQDNSREINTFRAIACVVLGGLSGALIVIPMIFGNALSPTGSAITFLSGLVAGGLIGFKRRASAGFLYFCVVCVLILSTLISFSLFDTKPVLN